MSGLSEIAVKSAMSGAGFHWKNDEKMQIVKVANIVLYETTNKERAIPNSTYAMLTLKALLFFSEQH